MQTHKSTIYFQPKIHQQVAQIAQNNNTTISNIINETLLQVLSENKEDLLSFQARANENSIGYDELMEDLKIHGKI
ncbi:MAG: CopG family transcriptional regulator [Gammaproteobacteria bacterium]|nr:MAG: CopG family transcriptional regulator [Gammaproteobacteria bacterium]